MRSLFPAQFLFVFKVMIYSAIASAGIKFGLPQIPAFSVILSGDLSVSTMNAIASVAITLPVALFGLVLWWRR
jgi:hypothetical protein